MLMLSFAGRHWRRGGRSSRMILVKKLRVLVVREAAPQQRLGRGGVESV